MDGPEPTTATVDYILTEDLQPLSESEGDIQAVLERLQSKDWLEAFHALTSLRQLAKFQPEHVNSQIGPVLAGVVKSVKSPRSNLCKGSLMAAGDLFTFCSAAVAGADGLKDFVLQLMLKASQSSKFLADEAETALALMAKGLPSGVALTYAEFLCTHTNPRVRAKATTNVQLCASLLNPAQLHEHGFEALLKIAAKQLSDQLPESRDSAKELLQQVHAAHVETHPGDPEADGTPWSRLCVSVLPALQSNAVLAVTETQSS